MSDLSERISKLSSAKLALLAQRQTSSGERVIRRRTPGDVPAVLSFAQQRMWILNQLEPNSAALNTSAAVRLCGPLEIAALNHSLFEVVRRHEALRTSFPQQDGGPIQVVQEVSEWKLPLLDLSALTEGQREQQLRTVTLREAEKPFDLSTGPVLRTTLVKLGYEHHILQIVMHHIVSDGWSMGVLVREIAALYEVYLRGETSPLAELPVQYTDYAEWQREWLKGEAASGQLQYWKQQLSGAPASLEVPVDKERRPVLSYRGETVSFDLGEELSRDLKAMGRSEGATLFMVLLTAFKTLLYRYTGQSEIVVGTNIANRNHGQLEGLIGCFVNNLVLRTDLSGNPRFSEALRRVREVTLAAYANQDLPYEVLAEALRGEKGPRAVQLFQVMFVLQNSPVPSVKLEGLTLSFIPIGTQAAAFDLILYMSDSERGLVGHLQYDRDLFNASTIERMIERLQTLLRHAVAEPNEHIASLSLAGSAEMEALTASFNVAL